MSEYNNPEVFRVNGDRTVTVSVTFNVDRRLNERDTLLNAAEAIKFYAQHRSWKSWAKKIKVN